MRLNYHYITSSLNFSRLDVDNLAGGLQNGDALHHVEVGGTKEEYPVPTVQSCQTSTLVAGSDLGGEELAIPTELYCSLLGH